MAKMVLIQNVSLAEINRERGIYKVTLRGGGSWLCVLRDVLSSHGADSLRVVYDACQIRVLRHLTTLLDSTSGHLPKQCIHT